MVRRTDVNDSLDFGFRLNKIVLPVTGNTMFGKIYGPYVATDPKGYKVGPADQYFIVIRGGMRFYITARSGFRLWQPTTQPTPVIKIFDTTASGDSYYAMSTIATWHGTRQSCHLPPPVIPNLSVTPAPATLYNPFFQLLDVAKHSVAYAAFKHKRCGRSKGRGISYLLISAGPDGVFFTADDVVGTK